MEKFFDQGGLSEEPMWADRAAEIRDLHPRLIRIFIQEYFDLLPERGRYHFQKLDESVDLILKTGAKPLMNIDFKPKVLYPAIDHKIVDPTSYEEWEQLIYNLVRHYKERDRERRESARIVVGGPVAVGLSVPPPVRTSAAPNGDGSSAEPDGAPAPQLQS